MPAQLTDLLPNLLKLLVSQTIWLVILTAIFVPVEHFFARNSQRIFRHGWQADLGYYYLSAIVPAFILALPLAAVLTLSREILPIGYFQFVSNLPLLVQIAAGLFVGEIGSYWSHRATHEIAWMWRFHAIHHEAEEMDWLVNSRAHPFDMLFSRMCGLALVYMAGLATPGSISGSVVPTIVLFAGTIWTFLIHANLNWNMGWFEYVLSTPRFHHWHHSRIDHINRNYAAMLPIFDKMFGTLHLPPKAAWPASYGIAPENLPEALRPYPIEDAEPSAEDQRASNISNSCAIEPSTSIS